MTWCTGEDLCGDRLVEGEKRVLGGRMEGFDDSWAGKDMGICEVSPSRDCARASCVLRLYGAWPQ